LLPDLKGLEAHQAYGNGKEEINDGRAI